MKLIVVTTPTFFVEEDKIITALLKRDWIFYISENLRHRPCIPNAPVDADSGKISSKRIVTHEHFYLKEEFNLMGIHLNARNPRSRMIMPDIHVSCSCHSVEEVKNRKHFYDYVFMSPIYDSISKVNYYSTYTAEELREAQKD